MTKPLLITALVKILFSLIEMIDWLGITDNAFFSVLGKVQLVVTFSEIPYLSTRPSRFLFSFSIEKGTPLSLLYNLDKLTM